MSLVIGTIIISHTLVDMKKLILLSIICLVFSSCLTYGDKMFGTHVYINNFSDADKELYSDSTVNFYKDLTMYLVDDSYKNKHFIELGTVEVIGSKYDSKSEILDALKLCASKMNAHALVDVKQFYQNRTSGYLSFIELKDYTLDTYSAPVYTAVAIRFKTHHPDLVMMPIKLSSDSNNTY